MEIVRYSFFACSTILHFSSICCSQDLYRVCLSSAMYLEVFLFLSLYSLVVTVLCGT